jgi:ubiquinone/menaquinone biosynthesis C-methylase UbiE
MKCPICGACAEKKFSVRTREAGEKRKMILRKCQNCGAVFAEDFEKDRAYLYGADYAAWGGQDNEKEKEISKSKKKAFERQLRKLLKFVAPEGKKLLDVGTGPGYLLECAERLGFSCWGTEISRDSAQAAEKKFPGKINVGKLNEARYSNDYFDVITMTDVLEHLSDPHETMAEIKRILKPGGYLLIISPNFGSVTRKIFGRDWFQYKYEHVFYFNKRSLKHLLGRHGLSLLEFKNNAKDFFVSYYGYYFEKYTIPVVGNIFKKIFPILPGKIKKTSFPISITGEFIAIAQKNNVSN